MNGKTRYIGSGTATTVSGGNVLESEAFAGTDSQRLPVSKQLIQPSVTPVKTMIVNQLTESQVDPVVGWVVVIAGKGKGQSFTLVTGVNSIGRDVDQHIALNCGDEKISRKQHALITYEPNAHVFYLQNGMGSNLTYLDHATNVVLQPTILQSGQCILIGDTILKFVALCSADFDWHTHAA